MIKKGPYTDDKYQYKFNLINKVPPGVILVSKNVFTGKVKNVEVGDAGVSKLFGLNAMVATWFPWVQTKYVSSLSKTIDYKEFGYVTKDRVTLMVDLACEIKIVDGAKYEFKSSTLSEQLKVTIDAAVRKAIITRDVDVILSSAFNLQQLIQPTLDSFKLEYGLEITKLQLQNIKLPQDVKKSYEKKLTTNVDVERIEKIGGAEANVQSLKNKTEIEKQKEEMSIKVEEARGKSDVEVEQFRKVAEILKNCTPEEKAVLEKFGMALFADGVKPLYVQNTSDTINSQSSTPKSK